MPNVAAVLKMEIGRLADKAARKYVNPLRATVVAQKKEIVRLKRQVAALEKMSRSKARPAAAAPRPEDDGRSHRFQARGVVSERKRLGLSQQDYGRLVGVSGATILSWEQRKSSPRHAQLLALAAVRGIGKKEAAKRLE